DTIDGSKRTYKNQWGLGPNGYGSFYAVGLYGQFIYVYPQKNVVIVRTAKLNLNKNTLWKYAFLQIADQL
ncbi:MAG TPA: serine hydrolase, partial [Sphingobacteriaceae bacterium]|nr:serine hydrolase [Sphingobacteriaceae bacterium]